VWDETVVLPGSAIGDVAIFARRKGSSWFLGVVNGPEARKISIPLSFLGGGNYHTLLARDTSDGNSINVENSTTDQAQSVTLDLLPGGGFVERFEK
jgi:alpha-glucosidase